MSVDDLKERYLKHGKAWRYVWLLEQELERRKTRQSFIWSMLIMNVIQFCAIIYLLVHGAAQ